MSKKKNIATPRKNGQTSSSIIAENNGVKELPSKNAISDIEKNEAISVAVNELKKLKNKKALLDLLKEQKLDYKAISKAIRYEEELEQLQIELVKMQGWVQENDIRLAVIFEGRDAAGKGGVIRRFMEHLNPRSSRVVALPKPTEVERGQWYFQRYLKQLPNKGEIVFFDRSWYNRAVVEPINGFCSDNQYEAFMQQVPEVENMLHEDGIIIIKFWFSISKEEQKKRFNQRKKSALKQWKLSPVDATAQDKWGEYTKHKELMLNKTHTNYAPWIIVKANNKEKARLESMRYVLSTLPYLGKERAKINLLPDPDVVSRYHKNVM